MVAMSGKRKKTITLIILTIVCFLVGSATYYFEESPQNTDRYYIDNSGGAVLFEHGVHGDQSESCADCHHPLFSVTDMTSCSECHDEDVLAEDFSHKEMIEIEDHNCSFCHPVNEDVQPQSCGSCHPKLQEESEAVINCMECHDDSYTADLLTHDEMQEIEDHTCEGCHNAKSLSDSYHKQCNGCHAKENEELFIDSEGKTKCSACHLIGN